MHLSVAVVLINSKINPVCRDRGLSNQTKVFGFVVVFQAHAECYIYFFLLRTCWNSALVYVLQDLLSRANDFYWRYDLAELHASSKARETTSTRGNYLRNVSKRWWLHRHRHESSEQLRGRALSRLGSQVWEGAKSQEKKNAQGIVKTSWYSWARHSISLETHLLSSIARLPYVVRPTGKARAWRNHLRHLQAPWMRFCKASMSLVRNIFVIDRMQGYGNCM